MGADAAAERFLELFHRTYLRFHARAASGVSTGASVPGMTGTPAAIAILRAEVLSPIWSSTSGDGPTKMRPSSAQRRANCAFSLKNP